MPQKLIIMIAVAAAVLAGGLYVGLSRDDGSPQGPSATLDLTVADDGSSIALAAGDTLKVTLEGNSSTGYSWELQELEGAVLRSMGEPTYAGGDDDVVGSPGLFTFTFETIGEGEVDLQLVYHRPWETEPPIDTFTVHVTVS